MLIEKKTKTKTPENQVFKFLANRFHVVFFCPTISPGCLRIFVLSVAGNASR